MAQQVINDKQKAISTSKPAASMADLMKTVKSPFVTLSKGKIVEGVITKLTPSEILVDIHAKSEAVVLEKDKNILRTLLSSLKAGDKVTVGVLNPESDAGHPVVSLRRFLSNAAWDTLKAIQQKGETLEVEVLEFTRGGFIVDSKFGITGFLPSSQVMLNELPSASQNSGDLLGRTIQVYITELNKEARKVVFSQRPVISTKEFSEIVKNFKEGQKIESTISHVTSFGLFVVIPVPKREKMTIDGLVHISEVAWEEVTNLQSMYQVGHKIECVVVKVDMGSKRLDLSIKRLQEDPFEKIAKQIASDQKLSGTVRKITALGVIVDLVLDEKSVEGLIRKEKIPPTVSYEEGQKVQAVVTEIDKRKHRILLSPVLKEKPIGYR